LKAKQKLNIVNNSNNFFNNVGNVNGVSSEEIEAESVEHDIQFVNQDGINLRSRYSEKLNIRKQSFLYKLNSWQFMNNLNASVPIAPTFDINCCKDYFSNIYRERHPNRVFVNPNWMPPVPQPTIHLNTIPPNFQNISKKIRYMKIK